MSNDERFKVAQDMSLGVFQAFNGIGGNVEYIIIDDGEDRISVSVPEARALYEWLGKVIP